MKIRFSVDQAECFRNGIDCPKSIVSIEVKPADLQQKERNLIADRLQGINVCELFTLEDGTVEVVMEPRESDIVGDDVKTDAKWSPVLIRAKAPTFEALLEAIYANQKELDEEKTKRKKVNNGRMGPLADSAHN